MLVVGAVVLMTPRASADPRCGPQLWRAEGSSWLAPTARCGSYILSTEAAALPWSWAAASYTKKVPTEFVVQLRYLRLTPDQAATFEVHVPGGAVLFKPGRVGFYESEGQFARDGWRKVPATFKERRVRIEQRGKRITVWFDQQKVTWTFAASGGKREIKIAAKGYPGLRSRVRLREVRVDPLQ